MVVNHLEGLTKHQLLVCVTKDMQTGSAIYRTTVNVGLSSNVCANRADFGRNDPLICTKQGG
jgi:hypothetical protein